jgi:cytochrome c-type biogenesis protein CcmH
MITLWLILIIMAALAAASILLPLVQPRAGESGGVSDTDIYRDQLAELERDVARGVIGRSEAEAARIEISRRLLNADARAGGGGAHRLSRAALAAVAATVPAVALGLYMAMGQPALPGQPLASRLQRGLENGDLRALVAQVERHLRSQPQDGRGWQVIAPVYANLGRFEDAAMAYRNAIRLLGASADRAGDLGEVLVLANGGVISAEARNAFEMALASDPRHSKSRFFLGLADQQQGNDAAAVERWSALLADAPADAPWREDVAARIAAARGTAQPGPTAGDVAAAQAMPAEERAAMIRSMVNGLDRRLAEQGGTGEEWGRLIRAYVVLQERDAAHATLERARAALAGRPEEMAQVAALAAQLGLEGGS